MTCVKRIVFGISSSAVVKNEMLFDGVWLQFIPAKSTIFNG